MNIGSIQAFLSLEKSIAIVWGLVLFTLPLPLEQLNSQLIILLIILAIFYFYNNKPKSYTNINFHLYYAIPFVISLLSIVFISHKNINIMESEASSIAFPVLTFLLLNSGFRFSRKRYHALLVVFLISIIAIILFTYIRSFYYSEKFFSQHFITFNVIHPAYFSLYCAISILIIIYLLKNKSPNIKLLGYVLIVCIFLYMTLLAARMSIISLLVVLLGTIFLSISSYKKKLTQLTAFGILIILMSVIIVNSPKLKYRFALVLEKSIDKRMVSWKAAWDTFVEYPLFGIGNGNAQPSLNEKYIERLLMPDNYIGFNSHNYYLEILMTFGVIGFVLILLFWKQLMSAALHSKDKLFIQFIILFLLCSITEVMWARQKGIVFFYLFFSLNYLSLPGKEQN